MSTTPPRPGSAEPISSASSVSPESATDVKQDEPVEQTETAAVSGQEPAVSGANENSYTPNVDVNLVADTDIQSEDEQPVTTSVPKELSPVSPVPLHVPEPSKIPLLLDPALSRTIPNEEQIPSDIGSALSDPSLAGAGVVDEDSQEQPGDAGLLDNTEIATPAINGVGSNGTAIYQPNIEWEQQHPVQQALPGFLADGTPAGVNTIDTAMTGMVSIPLGSTVETQPLIGSNAHGTMSEPSSATQSVNLQALLASMASQATASIDGSSSIQPIDTSTNVNQPSAISPSHSMISPSSALPSQSFQPLKSSHSLPAPPTQSLASISHPTNLRHPLPENPTNVTYSEPDEGEISFSAEEEKAFENFLTVERDYVAKGEWSRFPVGSRLFIGNLSSERVSKRDVYHIFAKHGKLAQISIKQAYGFVQFFDVSSCTKALRQEQGTPVRGRQMHLEISKPQRNARNNDTQVNTRTGASRRSRSPDEPMSPRNRGSSYRGHGYSDRERESRNSRDSGVRGRDEYRPGSERRMSSPRSQYGRERDDYFPSSRDYRDRSRSPRGRFKSPTPPSRASFDRQRPSQPIDALIVVFDDLDPAYIKYVDGTFHDRRLRTDVLHMTARINLESHIKEQVLQGCHAVVFLTRATQQANKVSIQIFKGSAGSAGQYDEYDMIPVDSAAELVRRGVGNQPQYNGHSVHNSTYQAPPAPPTQPTPYQGQHHPVYVNTNQQPVYPVNNAPTTPNLTGILQNLDPATLQTLLAQLQQQQQQPSPTQYIQAAQHPQKPADLSALLGAAAGLQQQQQAYSNLTTSIDYQNPALVGLLGGLNPQRSNVQQQPQANQQVQNIMNQLTGQWPHGR